MLTRREQLLVRPWQQRRYNNHRRKVQSALPAIDAAPPPERGHVCCKLKKLQAEQERCARIEQDNIRLLQRMRCIALTRRVDNRWTSPPPNFLQRVGVYRLRTPTTAKPPPEFGTPPTGRRGRCAACNPALASALAGVVPASATSAESSVDDAVLRVTKSQATPAPQQQLHLTRRKVSAAHECLKVQQITIQRGPLQLSVHFPSPSSVSLQRGRQSRIIQREYCECSTQST